MVSALTLSGSYVKPTSYHTEGESISRMSLNIKVSLYDRLVVERVCKLGEACHRRCHLLYLDMFSSINDRLLQTMNRP